MTQSALSNPAARKNLIKAMEELSRLDSLDVANQSLALDNITAEICWLNFDEVDLSREIGITLYDEEEVRAAMGVFASLACLTELIGGSPAFAEIVQHRFFMSVMCTAAHAAEILKRSEVPVG